MPLRMLSVVISLLEFTRVELKLQGEILTARTVAARRWKDELSRVPLLPAVPLENAVLVELLTLDIALGRTPKEARGSARLRRQDHVE